MKRYLNSIEKMRKYLMAFAAVIFCTALTASTQETDWKKFFQIKDYKFLTSHKYTTDFNIDMELYSGEGYRAGMQNITFTLFGIQTDEDIPDTPLDTLTEFFSMTDMYGKEHLRRNHCHSNDMQIEVNEYLEYGAGNEDVFSYPIFPSFEFDRGGMYAVRTYIDFIDYDRRDTITIKDDPSLRLRGNNVVKTGKDVHLRAYYNTGYPYAVNDLTGEEYAKVTVFKHSNVDSTLSEKATSQYKLNIKDADHPLIAGIDSADILLEKPELGKYTLRFESNWKAIKSRDVLVSVEDTLRASVSLDKQTYVLATDKKARLGLTMDYGYPHIYAVKPDVLPTIRISAVIKQGAEQGDTLFCDSLKMANDSLQTKDLSYKGDWELDLTKIDQSKLNDKEKQLYVTIKFNNAQQYATTIPVSIQANATSINQVSTSGEEDAEAVYTLGGVRVSPKRSLPAGIYIRGGKKIIVK